MRKFWPALSFAAFLMWGILPASAFVGGSSALHSRAAAEKSDILVLAQVSRGELRRDRRDVRRAQRQYQSQRRDLNRAVRSGNLSAIQREARDAQRAQRRYRNVRRDAIHDRRVYQNRSYGRTYYGRAYGAARPRSGLPIRGCYTPPNMGYRTPRVVCSY
jgi:hypothetical protein